MHSVFRTVFLLAAAIEGCTAGVLSESTPKSDSNRDLLLVVNKGDQTLGIVDPESGLQLATVPVEGTTGHEVAAAPDGRTAWVPIYGNSGVGSPGTDGRTVAVIDLKSHTRIATVDLGQASEEVLGGSRPARMPPPPPFCIPISPATAHNLRGVQKTSRRLCVKTFDGTVSA